MNLIGLRLLGLFALVAVNGFFAAVEFSLVAVRLSRVRHGWRGAGFRAKIVLDLIGNWTAWSPAFRWGSRSPAWVWRARESTLASAAEPARCEIPGKHTVPWFTPSPSP